MHSLRKVLPLENTNKTMLVSKKNLQSYFDETLPSAQSLANTLMTHSFEIEGVEESHSDWVIDIDVLPNRAHDCLSHAGIAKEISVLLGIPLKEERYSLDELAVDESKTCEVVVENEEQCLRYCAVRVDGIEVKESPQWLRNRLEALGQKSINNLVDATNYIMLDLGQPMHVFDADKIVGKITVRSARSGEVMTSLSGEEIHLEETDLVIADDEGVLALAGVKGGVKAEVTEETRSLIIESANFKPQTTRKTARRVKILTDASKRYENSLSSALAPVALQSMLALTLELAGTDETSAGVVSDTYPHQEKPVSITLAHNQVANVLGFDITEEDIEKILSSLGFGFTKKDGSFFVDVPALRLDLRIPEDLIEEIGRIYGYHKIPVQNLDAFTFSASVNPDTYASELLRNYFIAEGFFEIKNYSFMKKGDVVLANPLGREKAALRKNLDTQMQASLENNKKHLDFIGLDQLALFEIDRVARKGGEELRCCFGIDAISKKNRKLRGNEQTQIDRHLTALARILGKDTLEPTQSGYVVSFAIQADQLNPTTDDYLAALEERSYPHDARFNPFSKYPYSRRDVSFWIEGYDAESLMQTLRTAPVENLKKVHLFDRFEKEGRVSYAFSLIFQSDERTLTDEDIDAQMEVLENTIRSLGGEIR